MISLDEARSLTGAKLSEEETAMIADVSSVIENAVRETFDGVGAHLVVPAGKATARVIAEVARQLRASGWHVSVGLTVARGPALIDGGKPQIKLISYVISLAADETCEQFMRARREIPA